MQFSTHALDEKIKHLDEIKNFPNVLKRVIVRNIGSEVQMSENQRIWRGGGATTYIISTSQKKIFLKVKHKNVYVESKIEEEKDFINEPCVEHEAKMLESARVAGVSVPETIFFDNEEGFQFLATEYISDSLLIFLENASVEDILKLWHELICNTRKLFAAGIVHSDIHEYNLRVRDGHPVLIDFEEARSFPQKCKFEQSLDYCGSNGISSLGEFPLANQQGYSVKTNCLLRMHEIFKKHLIPKILEFLKECNYDSSNGICTALDHGASELTYQSVQNKYFSVKGQRGLKDKRPYLIEAVLKDLSADDHWTFVDVGSNNGLFCREISKKFEGKIRAIGLEGFHKFNVLAKALAFIEDCPNIEYRDFLCGEDNMLSLGINNNCFMSICSVWHHIQKKEDFIKQLKELNLKYILFEMPIQKECYGGHSWEEEIALIKKMLHFDDDCYLANSHDYQRPLILLSKNKISDPLRNKLQKTSKKIYSPNIFEKLASYFDRLQGLFTP